MKLKSMILWLLAVCLTCAALAAEKVPVKRKKLTPAQEKASQYRAYERYDAGVKPARRKKIRAWFVRKASGLSYEIPAGQGKLVNDKIAGFRSGDFAFAVDKKTGAPVHLSIKNGRNLIDNAVCMYPFWELEVVRPGEEKASWVNPYDGKFSYRIQKEAMILIWTLPELRVSATVRKNAAGFAQFNITVKNRSQVNKLKTLDYPKLALTLPGRAEESLLVLPWRRGRLRRVSEMRVPDHEEYPGSSARFQMTALYDEVSGDGAIFTALDSEGNEKQFRQMYLPEYQVVLHFLRRFPVDRGKGGNQVQNTFKCQLGVFKGDWYDAALLYRKWWKQQKWASRGLLFNNDVPEYLKKAPVFLRYYLRQSYGDTAAKMEHIANAWAEFLPGRKLPGTLYHYSAFKEPPTRKNYPVSEYYGYCAEPFPGMVDALARMNKKGLRTNVYLQSEIYNQHDPRNDALLPTIRRQPDGKPWLYVNERYLACRGEQIWRKRYLEMCNHCLQLGFSGAYMDTFGKVKIDNECFDTRHGHSCGGGNIDYAASRKLGEDVFKNVRGGDLFIGGEACTEGFVDIMDYKLNAVHAFNGMIPLERVLYGDYLLSHGRVIRGNYHDDEKRTIVLDWMEGIIYGRFYSAPPKDSAKRQFLKDFIIRADQSYDYMRTGEMMRPMKFTNPVGEWKFTTEVHKNAKVSAWRNTAFRSYRDGSIGIAVGYIGAKPEENTLLLPDGSEWGVKPDAKIYRVGVDGKRTLLGKLSEIRQIPLKMSPLDVEFFVVK